MAEPVRHVDDLHRPADFPVDADGPPRRHGMPMDMSMAMPMEHGHDHHQGHGNDGQLHVMWEKCGYCSLLFNCPALPQTLSPLTAGSVIPCPPARRHAPGPCPAGCIPGARSRAPPTSIVV
jgi:hypothetical protein